MRLYQLAGGETVHFYKKSIVVSFPGERAVCSTGLNNGGCCRNLTAVFNNDGNPGPGIQFEMKADTYEEHLDVVAKELGLDPEHTSGLCTAASMKNVSIQTLTEGKLTVTAIVTGGVEGNGGRIGDPAVYDSHLGTINILLYISANLPDGALTRALVSCTEAKTAALQELLAPSRYSRGIATGSGTDGVIVICNPSSDLYLTDAGTHSKLGELIGKTVKKAVKEALFLQTGICGSYQHNIICRMDRFGITPDILWEAWQQGNHSSGSRMCFEENLDTIKEDSRLVTYTSLYAHLLDQLDWDLLSVTEAAEAGEQILKLAGFPEVEIDRKAKEKEEMLQAMIDAYQTGLLGCMEKRFHAVCEVGHADDGNGL